MSEGSNGIILGEKMSMLFGREGEEEREKGREREKEREIG